MSNLYTPTPNATAQEQYDAIKQALHSNVECTVHFTKKDGSVRIMDCSLDSTIIPQTVHTATTTTTVVSHMPSIETITVWCTDKSAWRAFKTGSVISIETKGGVQ